MLAGHRSGDASAPEELAKDFATLMLRQGDAGVFKRYSQAKLNMMREALGKLDRAANERPTNSGTTTSN